MTGKGRETLSNKWKTDKRKMQMAGWRGKEEIMRDKGRRQRREERGIERALISTRET